HDDDRLTEAFRRGDERALARVYERWAPLVYTLAVRSLGDVSDAEDVTQKTFVAAWTGRSGYRSDRASLSTWLIAIARNKIADTHEARARIRRLHEQLTSVSTESEWTVEPPDVAETLVVADEIARLEPDAQRV